MRRKKPDYSRAVTIIVLVSGLLAAWVWQQLEDRVSADALSGNKAVCTRVIDGDTIDVRTGKGAKVRIRLLGIDCPETHNHEKGLRQARSLGLAHDQLLALGKEATRASRKALEGKTVSLLFEGDEFPRDDYGRALCYVEVNGVDHGRTLLSLGLAEPRRNRHPKFGAYAKVAASARRKGVGLYK